MTLKDQILGSNDIVSEKVIVPEWGDAEVFVSMMSAAEREEYEGKNEERKGKRGVPHLLAIVLRDANGHRIFSDNEVEALASKNIKVLWRLFQIAGKLNKIGDEEEQEAKKA